MGHLLRHLPGQGTRVDLRAAAALLACLTLAAIWLYVPIADDQQLPLGTGGQAAALALTAILLAARARSVVGWTAALAALTAAGSLAADPLGYDVPVAVLAVVAGIAALTIALTFVAARPVPRATLDAGLIAAAVVGAVYLVEPAPTPEVLGATAALGIAVGCGIVGLRPPGSRRTVLVGAGLAVGALGAALMPEPEIQTSVWWAGLGLALPAIFVSEDGAVIAAHDLTGAVVAAGAGLVAGIAAAAGASIAIPVVCWAVLGVIGARVAAGALRDRHLIRELYASRSRDPVTGLGNREAFRDALASHLRRPGDSSMLVVFDLHGFKHYNDVFGELAGDGVLRHLAERLRAATWPARAFRLRGDEFAVISDFGDGRAEAVLDRAEGALTIRGNGFEIGAHVGAVVIPDETDDPGQAMRIADQRILIQRRASGSDDRWEDLERHIAEARNAAEMTAEGAEADLAALALAVGSQLDLTNEQLLDIARAASLHDLGRVAVPTTTSGAVAPGRGGEVDRNRHLIGERLLASAPDMRQAATIVRSVNECWDGSGDPDGLSGADIPVGSRILAVCEAFREARILRRDGDWDPFEGLRAVASQAGERFDPWVVAGLRSALERGPASGAGDGRPSA